MIPMTGARFQIRVCQNPECGLRYPLTEGSTFGDRCPACLGETAAALEKAIEREPIIEVKSQAPEAILHVLLDNVRSAWNVGSILRSADGFNFSHAYLCGLTPTPEKPEVNKTALGAEKFVTWSAHKNGVELVHSLKQADFEIWALEHTANSLPIDQVAVDRWNLGTKVLVVGNEVTGVDPGILEISDRVVHLPMRGRKRSFNVAVAFALAAHIMRSPAAIPE